MTGAPYERPPEETKRLARLAGAVYVSLGVATAIGYYHAPLVQGDLRDIARMITGPDLRFRIGVVSDVLAAVLGVPLALLLYQLLKPVHKTQAALMALLLLLSLPISFVVALNYVAAQMLLTGAPELSAFTGAQREAMGMLFLRLHTDGVLAVEIFFGALAFAVRTARHPVALSAPGAWRSTHHRGRGVCRAQRCVAATGRAPHHPLRASDNAGASCRGVPDHAVARDQGRGRAPGELAAGLTKCCSRQGCYGSALRPHRNVAVVKGLRAPQLKTLGYWSDDFCREKASSVPRASTLIPSRMGSCK